MRCWSALHKKSISTGFVSDPLPLRGRPPLQGGQKTVLNQRTFLPLEKGEPRAQRARGSISDFLCKAARRGMLLFQTESSMSPWLTTKDENSRTIVSIGCGYFRRSHYRNTGRS